MPNGQGESCLYAALSSNIRPKKPNAVYVLTLSSSFDYHAMTMVHAPAEIRRQLIDESSVLSHATFLACYVTNARSVDRLVEGVTYSFFRELPEAIHPADVLDLVVDQDLGYHQGGVSRAVVSVPGVPFREVVVRDIPKKTERGAPRERSILLDTARRLAIELARGPLPGAFPPSPFVQFHPFRG